MLNPANAYYKTQGVEFSRQQICCDLFVGAPQFAGAPFLPPSVLVPLLLCSPPPLVQRECGEEGRVTVARLMPSVPCGCLVALLLRRRGNGVLPAQVHRRPAFLLP